MCIDEALLASCPLYFVGVGTSQENEGCALGTFRRCELGKAQGRI